ncbi:MAG: hypothetical protein PVF73_01165 [Bacteroidales bacterium]|jgi:hypothetical protein
MEFKNTAEVLHAQAKEVIDLITRIENSGDLHAIEFDLLLEKLRNIYDLVYEMKESVVGRSEDRPSGELRKEAVKEKVMESVKEGDLAMKEKETNENPEENKTKDDPDSGVTGKKTAFVSDRFRTKPTLNEEMAGRSGKENLSSQLNLTPINSIAGAIGLNEKFELINELFDGDKAKFERTLEVLNQADSFVEAYNYLEENFNWDMDSVYVQRILELIRRKLIVRRNEK